MEKSLYDKIVSMRKRLIDRINQLHDSRESYLRKGNYQDAANCNLKMLQFQMVLDDLNEALKD